MSEKWIILPFVLFGFFGFFGLWILVRQFQLYKYLKKYYYERWAYLTSGRFWGPGGANSFRGIPYLYNEEDCEDKYIQKLKREIRNIIILMPLIVILQLIFGLIIWNNNT